MRRGRRLPFGAEVVPDGVRFRLWAPGAPQMRLALEGRETLPLDDAGEGWRERLVRDANAGMRYRYALPDGTLVPDPASRFQPDDVHAASEVIDPRAYDWHDDAWRGRPWHEAVVYELHVGAFTAAGTFAAAGARLPHLRDAGITAVEIMPVGDFPGRRNWGYDGVLWYAPDASYGRPEDFKRFIEAAHGAGIMVLLDVVYNHFGPDGNYLPLYAPAFFTGRHHTPWGDAINYDGEGSATVRDFAIENALYWLEEFHLDGLRLDAVHAIVDDSPEHLLDELARRVRAAITDRPVHLVLENEENDARRLARDGAGRPRTYTAQWNDDVHHVLHVAATGEDAGYYADYRGDTAKLGRALAEGFAFQGELMPFRDAPRGEPSAALPPAAFVAFAQNHDQIGNRAFGERLTVLAPRAAVRAASAAYLLLPQIPLLFMGEEWSTERPFPFFCDFTGELARAVTEGRRREFARFPAFADPRVRATIPDPEADATFAAAKLDWDALDRGAHAETLAWYRAVLAVRRETVVPLVERLAHGGAFEVLAPGAVCVTWTAHDGCVLQLAANLRDAAPPPFPPPRPRRIWTEGDGAWSVRWSCDEGGE